MQPETKVIHAGRHPENFKGAVNTPVYRTSTVISSTMAEWEEKHQRQASENEPDLFYGRHGTPTSKSLQDAIAELEGGFRSFVFPSGVSACIVAILAFTQSGDHVLVPDGVYGPVRRAAGTVFKRFGVEIEFYDPAIGHDIERMMRPNTRVVYTEAPASLTFEMQDIPAIAEVAHKHGAVVMMDNTWASPLYFKPFEKGVDVSIQAATKYICGHSDIMMGAITTTQQHYAQLKQTTLDLGQVASPDDCYLAMRGLRTMAVRLQRHGENSVALANWLNERPEVARVMHPALPSDPGHEIWKRDFLGTCGLFGFVLTPEYAAGRSQFIDALKEFGLGGSWGGYESLVMPLDPPRTVAPWTTPGAGVRLHAGLENVSDLIADLDQAFAAIAS